MEEKTEVLHTERDYGAEILSIIRSGRDGERIKEELSEYHENDIASIFEELTQEERENLLLILGSDKISEIVAYLEDAGDYLSEIDADDAAQIIESMDADDALTALEDLDEKTRSEIFELIEDTEKKEEIELIDSYLETQFGSRMSTNFIAVKKNSTIKEAMRELVSEAAEKDNINTIFAVNDDGTFYGAIDLKDLIIARSGTELDSIISTAFPYIYDTDDLSENIEWLRGYSEYMIPVLSSKNGSILGVITSTDIIELIDEERGDDYAKLAAMSAEPEQDDSLFKNMKKRIPWLIALLFMGLIVSGVVGAFEGVVAALPMIVSFQSLILGMAGNAGTQSLAVTIRALGSSDDKVKKRFTLIIKEISIAMLNGIALGLISSVIVSAYLYIFTDLSLAFVLATAGCVGLAMLFAMTISGFTGALIPITLHRFGIDPAVASGPLITTVNDLVAVISYYGLAWALLIKL